jgi:sulfotransferase family protein
VSAVRDPIFDRPVFIVSPPRSGSTLLFETLARARAVYTIGTESHRLIETIPELHPAYRGFESNRLLAADATATVATELRARFRTESRDRDGVAPPPRYRLLEKTPKNALRIPFLRQVFPEAHFVFLHRDVRQVLASMIDAWQSGRFRTYGRLPGWPHSDWSLLLTPGWRALAGKSLPEIVAGQWQAAMTSMLDDLQALPAERWCSVRYNALVDDPRTQVAQLCERLDLDWDLPLDATLRNSRFTLTPPDREKWRRHAGVIEPLLPALLATIDRATSLAA